MVEMTRRHNMVQERLVEALKRHRKLKDEDFRNNQTVSLEKFECLKDVDLREFSMLRRDLQFWVPVGEENKKKKIWKLFIDEFAIRFCRKTELMNKDTLAKIKGTKTNKYDPMILILRNEFEAKSNAAVEFKVEFRSFIISSLGAIPGDTISSFKSLIGKCPTSVVNLWIGRALRPSLPVHGAFCRLMHSG
jgi:hypothetical protein